MTLSPPRSSLPLEEQSLPLLARVTGLRGGASRRETYLRENGFDPANHPQGSVRPEATSAPAHPQQRDDVGRRGTASG